MYYMFSNLLELWASLSGFNPFVKDFLSVLKSILTTFSDSTKTHHNNIFYHALVVHHTRSMTILMRK